MSIVNIKHVCDQTCKYVSEQEVCINQDGCRVCAISGRILGPYMNHGRYSVDYDPNTLLSFAHHNKNKRSRLPSEKGLDKKQSTNKKNKEKKRKRRQNKNDCIKDLIDEDDSVIRDLAISHFHLIYSVKSREEINQFMLDTMSRKKKKKNDCQLLTICNGWKEFQEKYVKIIVDLWNIIKKSKIFEESRCPVDAYLTGVLYTIQYGLHFRGLFEYQEDEFLKSTLPQVSMLFYFKIPKRYVRVGKNLIFSCLRSFMTSVTPK